MILHAAAGQNKNKAVKPKRSDAPSCKGGNLASDDGKPTAGIQGIVEKWQRSRLLESVWTDNRFSVGF